MECQAKGLMLWTVDAGAITYVLVTLDDRVVACSQEIRWALDKTRQQLRGKLQRKGWKVKRGGKTRGEPAQVQIGSAKGRASVP